MRPDGTQYRAVTLLLVRLHVPAGTPTATDGAWAGILAAEPDCRRGVRGATVVELLLAPDYRGRGLGKHLSTLLAKALPLADDECLLGTIHADNTPAYRAALAAGRADVGGEVLVALSLRPAATVTP
jgi:GNAT superfamily N-acetyltransferase